MEGSSVTNRRQIVIGIANTCDSEGVILEMKDETLNVSATSHASIPALWA